MPHNQEFNQRIMSEIRPNPLIQGIVGELAALQDVATACTAAHPDHYIDSKPADRLDSFELSFHERSASVADGLRHDLQQMASRAIADLQGAPRNVRFTTSTLLHGKELDERMRLTMSGTGWPKNGDVEWRHTTHVIDVADQPTTVHIASTVLDKPGWVERAARHEVTILTDVQKKITITALEQTIVNAGAMLNPLEDDFTTRLRQDLVGLTAYDRLVGTILNGDFKSERMLDAYLTVIEETYENSKGGLSEEELSKLRVRALAMQKAMSLIAHNPLGGSVPTSRLLIATIDQIEQAHI